MNISSIAWEWGNNWKKGISGSQRASRNWNKGIHFRKLPVDPNLTCDKCTVCRITLNPRNRSQIGGPLWNGTTDRIPLNIGDSRTKKARFNQWSPPRNGARYWKFKLSLLFRSFRTVFHENVAGPNFRIPRPLWQPGSHDEDQGQADDNRPEPPRLEKGQLWSKKMKKEKSQRSSSLSDQRDDPRIRGFGGQNCLEPRESRESAANPERGHVRVLGGQRVVPRDGQVVRGLQTGALHHSQFHL